MTLPLDLPASAEQAILEATQIIRDHGRNLIENGWSATGEDLMDRAIAIERVVLRRAPPSEPLKEEMQIPNTSQEHLIASEAKDVQAQSLDEWGRDVKFWYEKMVAAFQETVDQHSTYEFNSFDAGFTAGMSAGMQHAKSGGASAQVQGDER